MKVQCTSCGGAGQVQHYLCLQVLDDGLHIHSSVILVVGCGAHQSLALHTSHLLTTRPDMRLLSATRGQSFE